jgi:glycosyltransferase involved in cell wall biosynthesis
VKILLLSPWFPTPPVNGSKIRIYHLLRALAGRHEISLISFIRPGEDLDLDAAGSLCREVKTIPFREFQPKGLRARVGYFSPTPRSIVDTYSPQMAQEVRRQASWAECIVASELVTAAYVRQLSKVPCVWDDLELATGWDAWQKANGMARLRRWLTWQKTQSYVRHLLPRFKAVTVVSEMENAILDEVAPKYRGGRVLPNGVDIEHNHLGLGLPSRGRLVYSGSLTYSANYDAVKYFLEEIFPLIHQQQPDANLEITGSTQGMDMSGLRLNEYARLTGFVADIRPVVAGAWACVVPLREGSGTRLKILEAMALGTPVISTSKGAEGLEVIPEESILIADGPTAFARQVVRLLGDGELRARLAVNGRQLVEQRYSWKQIGKDFCALVEETAKP